MNLLSELTEKIIRRYNNHSVPRTFTVAINGIDASGKGHIGKLLQERLEARGYKVANINIDPWQNLLPVRLRKEKAAENFYENVFRWDDSFEQLILPLQHHQGIYLETEGIRSDADIYYPLVYDFKEIDILLMEGIYFFK